MFSKSVQNRLKLFSVVGIIVLILVLFIQIQLSKNIVYFYSPKDIKQIQNLPKDKIRLGGIVKERSLKKIENDYSFILTDRSNDITVSYKGILPSLFVEGKSAVIEGSLKDKNFFIADTILAKHDENYMPPEVANALKKNTK
ncbi:MAG: cytochrome c maturation protein CcmE [Candidatus Fonsibacter sp.]|jgi:cytochrome c-type biogenesis protein CcmE|nr:cytochrome c maturation protein CcmE [Pelagibacterales bacterium]